MIFLRLNDSNNIILRQIYIKASTEANENGVFKFDYAEPQPVFYKYSEK